MLKTIQWVLRTRTVAAWVVGSGLVVSAAIHVACSSNSHASTAGDDDASATDAGPAITQACQAQATAFCMQMQNCDPSTLQTAYGDLATCESGLEANCTASLLAPSTGNTPAHTTACADAYASYACADYLNKTNIPAACAQVTGTIATGSACAFPGQCVSGYCAIAPGSACGTCATTPVAGSSCGDTTTCGPTLTCTTDSHICVVQSAIGQPCGSGQPCGARLSCVTKGGAGTAGTCEAAGTMVGAACDRSLKNGPGCDATLGLYCDALTSKCAMTTYTTGGQTCGYSSDAGTAVQCTAGSCQNGSCAARAAAGGACMVPDGGASSPNAGCVPPLRCVTAGGASTCTAAPASCP